MKNISRIKVVADYIIADFVKLCHKAVSQQKQLCRNKRFADTLKKNFFVFMREQINFLGATHFFGKISQIEKEICIEFVRT